MRLALIVAALSLLATAGSSVTERSVGNQRFALREGVWYSIDEHDEEWRVAPGRIFIKLTQGATPELALSSPSFSALSLERRLPVKSFYRFRFTPENNPIDVLAEAVSSPLVEAAFLDTYIRFLGDAYSDELWHLAEIRAERGWAVTTGSSDVTIAIIDDGFEYYHEDLAANVWANPNETPGDGVDNDADSLWYDSPLADDMVGWNFVDHDNDPSPRAIPGRPDPAHGTAVAGFASATKDNDLGVAGVAGGSASERPRFVAVRVNVVGDVTDAVEYCWRKGFDVISMSWTNNDPYGLVHALLDSAYADGAILVAASGNRFPRYVYPPASYSSVIAVGGVGADGQQLDGLSWGPEQELVAPTAESCCSGQLWTTDNYSSITSYNPEIYCACPADNERYIAYFNGTSAACPQVAAGAALIKSHWPSMLNVDIRQRLQASAIDIGDPGWDERFGYGRVDVYRALTEWGTIEGNVTWSPSDTHDGVRYVSGDLTIAPGDTLTILPGTVVRIAPDDDLATGTDTQRVEINVEGVLVAVGTASAPIIFEAWDDEALDAWLGFYIDSQSAGATFEHCVIRNAEYAIESWVDIAVSNCVIKDCAYAGIAAQDGALEVADTQIFETGAWGVFLTAASGTLRGLTVTECTAAGVNVQPSATLIAKGCSFLNNENGVYVNDTYGSVVIDSLCVFKHNDTGIHSYSSFPVISASVIDSNSTAGIYCDAASDPEISENLIRYNPTGIYCTNGSSPLVEANTIANNTVGVFAAYDSEPNLGHATVSGQNAIHANSTHHVANVSEVTLKAEDNWWGSAAGPKASKIFGSVDYNPFLISGPSGPESYPAPVTETRGPREFALGSVVPNPFNPATTIRYDVPEAGGRVAIRIYDVAGRLVKELVDDFMPGGLHEVLWDGTGGRGEQVASAVYFVEMRAGSFSQAKKLVLLK